MSKSSDPKIIVQLREIAGNDGVVCDDDELMVYECDAMTTHRARPLAVVFPRATDEVSRAVKLLHDNRIPFGPRGAGTGLSSGAIATGCEKGDRAVVIEMARMNRILDIDYANRRAVVQPGVINVKLSQA
ncbi:MAG: FAD-binding oxidoreductase, partial [Blastocatellia bacterium]